MASGKEADFCVLPIGIQRLRSMMMYISSPQSRREVGQWHVVCIAKGFEVYKISYGYLALQEVDISDYVHVLKIKKKLWKIKCNVLSCHVIFIFFSPSSSVQ